MIVVPGSVVVPDWHQIQEGKEYLGTLLLLKQPRAFGLLERPALSPQAAADVVGYKVFISGRSGVGKTALVAHLAGAEVPPMHQETPGIQTSTVFWPVKLRESGRALFFRFSFWDCGEAALKRFDHILPSCLEKVDAVLLLFSFTDRGSFEDLPQQASRVSAAAQGSGRAPLKMVVGTKFDQFVHSDVTEADLLASGHSWGLPILRVKSLAGHRAGLSDVAPLLNGLAEHLWCHDQADAGLLLPDTEWPNGPGSPVVDRWAEACVQRLGM